MNAQTLTRPAPARPIPPPPRRLMLSFRPHEYARLRALAERQRRDIRQQAELLVIDALAELVPDAQPDTAPDAEPAQVPA